MLDMRCIVLAAQAGHWIRPVTTSQASRRASASTKACLDLRVCLEVGLQRKIESCQRIAQQMQVVGIVGQHD